MKPYNSAFAETIRIMEPEVLNQIQGKLADLADRARSLRGYL